MDDYCNKVLAKHWPDVRRYRDVKEVGKHNLAAVDLICGGAPCQPFSCAGKRRGKEDDRHLWPEYLRIITELNPAWVIGENVPGLINLELDTVLSDLGNAGYATATVIIPACAVDAPHRRDRVFVVARNAEGDRGDQVRGVWQGEDSIAGRICQDVANTEREQDNKERGDCECGWHTMERGRQATQCGHGETDTDRVDGCGGNGRAIWLPEPDVGRVVARISPWLDGGRLNAAAQSEGTREILYHLRGTSTSERVQWTLRGHGCIQAQETLLLEVCEYAGAPKVLGNVSLESAEAQGKTMRSVWFNGKTACPSCRRAAREQLTGEHTNAVHILPQLLACDCGSTALDNTGTPSESSRTDRLKCLGNAVVPQVSMAIGLTIKEWIETHK